MHASNHPATPAITSAGGEDRLALSVPEAGRLLGISRDLAYDLVADGTIPAVRLGRRLIVPRTVLDRLLTDTTGSPLTGPSTPPATPDRAGR